MAPRWLTYRREAIAWKHRAEAIEAAAEQVDIACRELAWWTLPTPPPDHLTEAARSAIREYRRIVAEPLRWPST